jgi:hypothetical protein
MASCRRGKQHRWTVVSSKRGYVNCYWCGATKKGTTPGGCVVVIFGLIGAVTALAGVISNLPI